MHAGVILMVYLKSVKWIITDHSESSPFNTGTGIKEACTVGAHVHTFHRIYDCGIWHSVMASKNYMSPVYTTATYLYSIIII